MKITVPSQIKMLADRLPDTLYAVGGYVRNALIGLPPSDLDVCGGFSADVIKDCGFFVRPVNKRLGTAIVTVGDMCIEYTPFRTEEYKAGGGHTPYKIAPADSPQTDALRRDFTVNSLYYDIKNDTIIDPTDGLSDLNNKVLRAFDPEFTFKSDGLRLMRCVRLAAELGFTIEEKTAEAAKKYADNLKDISAERKRDELNKILLADQKYGLADAHYRALKLVGEFGLWKYILPSMETLKIGQNPQYHRYDVLEHTLLTVRYTKADLKLRLAAILHDSGKAVTMEKNGNAYGHADYSAQIAKKELTALKYPIAMVGEVSALCGLHMYDMDGKTSDAKMRIFAASNFAILDNLQALAIADKKATGMDNRLQPRFAFFKEQLQDSGAPLSVSELKIDGDDAQSAGLSGRKISEALTTLWRYSVIDPKLNNREWLLNMLKSAANRS